MDAALGALPNWHRVGPELRAEFRAPSFPEAIRLVDGVAEAAERAAHHPDIDIRYDLVRLVLSTHSAGGITDLDLRLAADIDTLAAVIGAHPVR